jgi:hypothetical protein
MSNKKICATPRNPGNLQYSPQLPATDDREKKGRSIEPSPFDDGTMIEFTIIW